jgi:hypothetical protein
VGVEAGGGSNNQDGRGNRTTPDEQQIRIERARLARGMDPAADPRPQDGAGGSASLVGAGAPRETTFSSGQRPIGAGAGPGSGSSDQIDLGPRFRPWSEPATSTPPGPIRCQFLKAVGPDGKLVDAQNTAVPAHRCAAFGDPLPLSLRQQELVCLQRVHVSCPRYARGTVLANETVAVPKAKGEQRLGRFSFLTLIGIGLVILAIGTLLSGLLGLPPFGSSKPAAHPATASPSTIAGASASVSLTPTLAVTPSAGVTPTAAATASPTPAAQTPTPTPKATPVASATWPPGATASRMTLLTQCAGQANCYQYTVRGPGPAPAGNGSSVADTLSGVTTWFGVNLNTVRQMNPWLNGSDTIHPGDLLKIPSPTR